ncbi:hypothetical protein VM1G_11419 [Cytospora mali]|uniref:Uncharacterized protein n=1 Tax=Cytospora mali TaxID=578113 RepID=A0A194VQI0_CYTMA|nr:hypothetical protein VM1G_11419 [Valsa mali]
MVDKAACLKFMPRSFSWSLAQPASYGVRNGPIKCWCALSAGSLWLSHRFDITTMPRVLVQWALDNDPDGGILCLLWDGLVRLRAHGGVDVGRCSDDEGS